MRTASRARQRTLLQAHPDLAGRMAQQRKLTAASTREQASAGLDQLGEAERANFQQLNEAYRARFGFPFIICARLSAKEAILAAMRARIANPIELEFENALEEVGKIAQLRLRDLLKGG
jgi:2-oxo-4-hydroxy-4-carboxy-5-ureidoimidazoline decarboxylase